MVRNRSESVDNPQKQSQPKLLGVGITAVVTALYLVFAFRGWHSFEELVALFPQFAALALFVGFIIAGLPVSRPIRMSFFTTFPAPFLSLFIYNFIDIMIPYANAGLTGEFLSTGDAIALLAIFFAMTGLLFALLASLGCYLGLKVREVVSSRFESSYRKQEGWAPLRVSERRSLQTTTDSDALRAARIGAWATVVVGLVGSFTTLATALIAA